jgi:hypothetical protein
VILVGLVARYLDAWNAGDAGECAACFAPAGVREWRVLAPPRHGGVRCPRFVGRPAIEESIAEYMASIPDLALDITSLSEGSDGRVWTEWRVTGTHRRDLGDWLAQDEPVDVRGVSIFMVGPEGFVEERVYWDMSLMTRAPVTA